MPSGRKSCKVKNVLVSSRRPARSLSGNMCYPARDAQHAQACSLHSLAMELVPATPRHLQEWMPKMGRTSASVNPYWHRRGGLRPHASIACFPAGAAWGWGGTSPTAKQTRPFPCPKEHAFRQTDRGVWLFLGSQFPLG